MPTGAQAPVDGMTPFITPNGDFYRVDTALDGAPAQHRRLHAEGQGHGRQRDRAVVDRPPQPPDDRARHHDDVRVEHRRRPLRRHRPLARCPPRRPAPRGRRATRRRQVVGRSSRRLRVRLPGRQRDGRPRRHHRRRHERRAAPARSTASRRASSCPGCTASCPAPSGSPRSSSPASISSSTTGSDAGWAEKAPIKLMSRIDVPQGPRPRRRPARSPSVAWRGPRRSASPRSRYRSTTATGPRRRLADQDTVDTWRQWSYAWDATSGNHSLRVRATDQAGELQTDERADPIPDGASGLAPDPRSRRLTTTAAVAVRSRAPSAGDRFAPIETGYRWTGHARSCDAPTGPEWHVIP